MPLPIRNCRATHCANACSMKSCPWMCRRSAWEPDCPDLSEMSQTNHLASEAMGNNFVTVPATLERPASETLASYSRDQKFKILQENSEQLRRQLLDWLKEQSLSEEVLKVGE